MKSTVYPDVSKSTYPCLMKSDTGTVVLMDGFKTGMTLSSDGSAHHIGEYRTDWNMDYFYPFYGSVTIEA